MPTTALFIEIIITGIIAEIWIILGINFFSNDLINFITQNTQIIKDLGTLSSVILIGFTYSLGWIVHFLGEIILDPIFQTQYRDRLYKQKDLNFFHIRTEVFEHASDTTLQDIQFDRQLLRIARSNTFNFTILTLVLNLYSFKYGLVAILFLIISLILALLSFFQWKNRYTSTFYKFIDIYKNIQENKDIHSIKIIK